LFARELEALDYPADLKGTGPKPTDAYGMNTEVRQKKNT
jgi:hypothetical protein